MKLLIVMTVLMMSLAKIKSDEDMYPCHKGTRKGLIHDPNLARVAETSLNSIIKHGSNVGSDEVKKTGGGLESPASMKNSFCRHIFTSQRFLKKVKDWEYFGCFSVDDNDLEKLSVLCKFSKFLSLPDFN